MNGNTYTIHPTFGGVQRSWAARSKSQNDALQGLFRIQHFLVKLNFDMDYAIGSRIVDQARLEEMWAILGEAKVQQNSARE